ncbi:MAG TPA: hypothetical protein VFY29_06400 [Terriglobia bacterium]|nr:hypothetical protein [Terriglobia bacterium]
MRHRSRIAPIAGAVLSAVTTITILGGAFAGEPPSEAPARNDGPVVPLRLSDTGLYGAGGAIDPRNRPFVPQYPLWSDGAEKQRWIRLPENTPIDISDIDAWRFPVGARFWKQFSWNGRKIETRMIWKAGENDWIFATYVWAEDQRDAVLAPETGVPNVVEVGRGKRHSIPAIEDCHTCHLSSPAVVLGFNALQLSDDRDPMAPHAEPLSPSAVTLRTLLDQNRLHPARPDLAAHPPRIRETDPVGRAALGYLSANCGGCHNDRGPLARLGLVLLHDTDPDGKSGADMPEPARATAVNAAGRYVMPGIAPERSRTVAPGAPERSALLHRMRSRRPSSQMPPLGTAIPDEEAVELVRRWIEQLERR